LLEQKMNQSPARATVAVCERVDRFELGVCHGRLRQRRKIVAPAELA